MLETLDHTIRIGSTPTFLYFDLYLYSAYAAHYVYIYIITVRDYRWTKVTIVREKSFWVNALLHTWVVQGLPVFISIHSNESVFFLTENLVPEGNRRTSMAHPKSIKTRLPSFWPSLQIQMCCKRLYTVDGIQFTLFTLNNNNYNVNNWNCNFFASSWLINI